MPGILYYNNTYVDIILTYIYNIIICELSFSNTIDQAVGSEEVSEIFLTKYKALFNSVPTSDTDLERLHGVMHDIVELDNRV